MKIVDMTQKGNELSFVLKDSTVAYANALRRAIISLVPTLAIEEVTFQENNSALYDEVIAHRLGLLPLITDLQAYSLPESPEKGLELAQSSVKLSLEAHGPGTVCADQLVSRDPKVKCAVPKLPIVKLLEGQSLKFEATAVLGQAITHTKWSPATAYYQYVPTSGKKEIKPEDIVGKKSREIDATGVNTDDILFTIESWGQLDSKEILKEAINQLNIQVKGLEEAFK